MLQLLIDLEQKNFIENVYPFGEYHHVVMKDGSGEALLQQAIQNKKDENAVAKKVQADIEDCFIALMKN